MNGLKGFFLPETIDFPIHYMEFRFKIVPTKPMDELKQWVRNAIHQIRQAALDGAQWSAGEFFFLHEAAGRMPDGLEDLADLEESKIKVLGKIDPSVVQIDTNSIST